MNEPAATIRARLRTPRAAAVAGMAFAVLFTISIILIRLSVPEDLAGPEATGWIQGNTASVSLALTLVPFAGIAFLWFMGVVRDHLGTSEDQFFATVFFGSGLLFLSMVFVSAAIAGSILSLYSLASDRLLQNDITLFGRAMMHTILNVYAIRMAGVFMISLATIWVRTRAMPRPFALLTYGLALIMLVSINVSLWLILVFPVWVFMVSTYILILVLRRDRKRPEEIGGMVAG